MGEYTNLPPGFVFFPSDEELVVHFLCRKAAHQPCHPDIVPTIDLHRCDPWDLNGKALEGDGQWYFFTLNTQHSRRHTPNGYWEAVGPDEPVSTSCGDRVVGTKRTLGFYYVGEDRPDQGIKTNWVMHEYHLLNGAVASTSTSTSTRTSRRRSSSNKTGNPTTETNNKWEICRVYEATAPATCGSHGHDGGGRELSCLDEVFLSMDDDFDEVSFPYITDS